MDEINQEINNKDDPKVDGKYIFVPEGYMSVIIPIKDESKNSLPSLNPTSLSNPILNHSIPNSCSNSQVNSPSLNKSFIGPGKNDETLNPSEILKHKNEKQTQQTIDGLIRKNQTNKTSDLEKDEKKQPLNTSQIENKTENKTVKKIKKIPRPKNSFLFYLHDKTPDFLKINPNINRRDVSKAVGQMWRNETEEVKKYYAEKARIELEEHKLKYPNYKFTPDRSKKNKKSNNEAKKSKEMKKKLENKKTSLDDLSIIQNKQFKHNSRQRSTSSSIYQSKKLEEMYHENKMEYDQELDNDHILYQTLINSISLNNMSNNNNNIIDEANPQVLNINSRINNDSHSSLDNSYSNLGYEYDSSSLVGTDFSSSYFDELSLSSYSNSLLDITNITGSSVNLLDQANVNNMVSDPSTSVPVDINPMSLNKGNEFLLLNNTLSAFESYQTPLDNTQGPFIIQSQNNDITTIDPLPQMTVQNDINMEDSFHSPSFDAIFEPILNTNSINNNPNKLKDDTFNTNGIYSTSIENSLSDLTNTIVPSTLQNNILETITPVVPSNDNTNKSKRLSQIQQKNNLRIITSAEDLNEIANSLEVVGNVPLSDTTTSTVNTDTSTDYSKYADSNGSNKSTPSYLLSKMQLMENFNALNLNNSARHKNSLRDHPYHSHHRSQSHSQCNSASVVMDKPSLPLVYPLSAGLWNPGYNNFVDYTNFNGLEVGSTPASVSSNSGANSASTNTSVTNPISFNMENKTSLFENNENFGNTSNIHSINRSSSSIKKKTKPIGMGLKFSHKKSSSLSKLNSCNSLLSTSESSSTSSSSFHLNTEKMKSLSIFDPSSVDLKPPSTIDLLNLDNNDNNTNYDN
ncbi:hypothetical protein H8356DRAFT_974844 [Neocallimastix lanati (nom. inval.)]|jgi:hypothetical protein|nr:hypothetical protein H8356DRAFT_974844 [Neocallimastix sp. JGI-2020a]